MIFLPGLVVASLLSTTLPVSQEEPARTGFAALANDPYMGGTFQDLEVSTGHPARVLSQTVHGERNGLAFVNVLRWTDARPFRGQLISLRLPVRFDVATIDTTARLWVRVVRADGGVGFEDTGFDTATASSEWTTLSSTGAIAEDATDLWFGVVVEGPTPLHFEDFSIEVGERASSLDVRHSIPGRWARDPEVRCVQVADPGLGIDLQVTTFRPAGHDPATLPRLWLIRDDDDLRESYTVGRALLQAMRLGQDPPALVSVIQPRRGHLPALAKNGDGLQTIRGLVDAEQRALSPPLVAWFAAPSTTPLAVSPAPLELSGGATPPSESALTAFRDQSDVGGALHPERIALLWASASFDAGGDAEVAALIFDAALVALEPWTAVPTIQQASHSLAGHQCDHDH